MTWPAVKNKDLFVTICVMSLDQERNFSRVREISIVLVFSFQPKKFFVSSIAASAASFVSETKSGRWIGSCLSKPLPVIDIANSTAALPLFSLSPLSTVIVILSSM